MLIYNKLWNTLKEKGMKRTDLLQIMSSSTLAKMGKNEKVSLDVIEAICEFLDCQPGDIIEHVSEKTLEEAKKQLDNMNQMLKAVEQLYPGVLKQIGEQFADGSEAKELFKKGDFFGSSIIDEALNRESSEDEEKKDPTE